MNITEAVYSAGINWCWFYIRIDGIVAVFRLHLDEDLCWTLFKALNAPTLFRHPNSSMAFGYGNQIETRKSPKTKSDPIKGIPPSFDWLEKLLTTPSCRNFSACAYHGVSFVEFEE
jgi:hypothetical protein